MTIPPELESRILRYYHAEKWRVGPIATPWGVHHGTVRRVLAQAGLPTRAPRPRPSRIDPYLPFIRATLEQFPTLTASRLYPRVRERGYLGAPDHFRHLVSLHRPRRPLAAYLRLRRWPGAQAQVDWGHFGHLEIGRARRPLMAFVRVLSYSRQIVLRFFLDARMENFLRGHVAAFQALGGVARVLWYDHLKSAVLERQGFGVRFHPPCWPSPVTTATNPDRWRWRGATRRAGWNGPSARSATTSLPPEAIAIWPISMPRHHAWCLGPAAERRCPEDTAISVREAFVQEQPRLLEWPDNPFPTEARVDVNAGKTP